jgi:hypothetical protein
MSYGLAYTPYNTNLFLGTRSINPDTDAFITAAGITGVTEIAALNTLVNGLQLDGLWTKMKAIYPFATDNRNLSSYTEDYVSNANWGRSNMTTTANTIISPNGTLTASTATTTANANHALYNANPVATSTNQTFTNSIYLKYNNAQWITLEVWNGGAQNGVRLWVDIQNGVLGTANATIGSYTSSSITNVGNGWYRVSVTGVMPNASAVYLSIRHVDGNGAYNFTAVNGKSTYIWGAQSEVGTLTAYQPIATSQQAYIASQFKYNLKDPRDLDAAFRLVFNGGWTHSSTGATPNGTNGYADTLLIPSTSLSISSSHLSVYSRTNTPSTAYVGYDIARGNYSLITQYNGNIFFANLENAGLYLASATVSNGLGFYIASRINNTSVQGFKNSSKLINAVQSSSLATSSLLIGSIGTTNFSSKQYAFASIGDGLTDTEAANFYTRVQAFQTALSRQV